VTLIKQSLAIDAVFTLDQVGQFEIISDGQRIAERGGNLHISKIATKKPHANNAWGFVQAQFQSPPALVLHACRELLYSGCTA